jgi:hypothetical protein
MKPEEQQKLNEDGLRLPRAGDTWFEMSMPYFKIADVFHESNGKVKAVQVHTPMYLKDKTGWHWSKETETLAIEEFEKRIKYPTRDGFVAHCRRRMPIRAKLYLNSDKDYLWVKGKDLGLSEDARSEFAGALYEIEFEVEVEFDGTYKILQINHGTEVFVPKETEK